jgi:hypothetical protein
MLNRKKAILFIAMLEALFFGIMVMLYLHGVMKMMTFVITIVTVSLIVNVLLIVAVRKLPPM